MIVDLNLLSAIVDAFLFEGIFMVIVRYGISRQIYFNNNHNVTRLRKASTSGND
ncbi:hypothetical protein [Candidatus Nitrosocosmicus franklandus]|uniref:Uncharacterized protein n=1 Tax=Candidatus Nitrosocosmicus franklandianus TaxID=1798806 RepID=A0A484IDU7_9ARCH|nr:hypothetical protein [Candidatus Nitrosocosmicus franklandus]VFJ14267.1 protein of unknown function [Candidatus Nitrosocosmicus franklandus]